MQTLFKAVASCSCVSLSVFCLTVSADVETGKFVKHAEIVGRGKILNSIVAPGPDSGSQWVYTSYINIGGEFDIVATDPKSGNSTVFKSPLPKESGAWALAEGPDHQVYVGTLPSAHIMRVDWKEHRLVDLGAPSPKENYIWQLTLGSDGKLYGGTAPDAKLIRFDPRTGKSEDLGRMSDTQNYARFVAADNHGFVYIGIGMAQKDLIAYEIATGQHRSILPEQEHGPGVVTVIRGTDGAVYAKLQHWVRLSGWRMAPVENPPLPSEELQNGMHVSFEGSRLLLKRGPAEEQELTTNYQGGPIAIYHVAAGPDGWIYGSTTMPIRFFRASTRDARWDALGEVGQGEIYSMTAWHDRLIAAAYSAQAPIMIYRPNAPWQPGTGTDNNPRYVHYQGENETWRPLAMIAGPDDKVYIAGEPGYGLLGGPLCVLDPKTGQVTQYMNVVSTQSIVALAALPDGRIVGGTTIQGGSGSHPVEKYARLFIWDPKTHSKVFETVPAPGESAVDALAVGRSGLVYGFAGKTMFVFDAAREKVVKAISSDIGKVLPNALGPGPGGTLYGLTQQAIFRIDEPMNRPTVIGNYPDGINRGFAIVGHELFFTHDADLLSFQLP